MTHHFPHLTWLRAFEAAARHLSFTHAAAELNLTQAAVSKQVRLLELHLREPMFDRQARSLTLTKVGAAYLPKVRDAFERLGAGTYEVFGNRRTDRLTIRSAIGFSVNWLAHRLPDFLQTYPGIQVRIISTIWNEDPGAESYDFDIRYGLGNWPGFHADQISWETLQPVCAPALARRLVAPADLAGVRLLHVLGYNDGWATWLAAAGAGSVDAAAGLQVDNSVLAFAIAAGGGGVALGRTSMIAQGLNAGLLVRPFPLCVPVQEAFYLVSPDQEQAGYVAHPDAQVFRGWLMSQIRQDRL